MKTDRVRGKTIRWTFSDGPMANRTFEHIFEKGGAVKFRILGDDAKGKLTREKKYEVARLNADVYTVSYLGSSGYTLTVVLDYRTGHLVAFASNEKGLMLQHGTFEVVTGSIKASASR
jgi:MoaF N-terminal domain